MSEILANNQQLSNNPIPSEFIALDNDLRFIKVKKSSKIPLESDWQNTNNYSVNDPSLIQWIQSGGNYGYFLQDNTDLCVLDADKPEELKEIIEYIGSTLTVQSGRNGTGYHILFRCPNLGTQKIYLKNNGRDIGDIRPGGTDRKYQTVGPGSIHPDTGRPYAIIYHSAPAEVDKSELLKVIKKYQSNSNKYKAGRRDVKTGEIDNYLTQQAGKLFNQGLRDTDLFNALSVINQEDCTPPSEDSNLRRICASAMRNFTFKPKVPIKPQPTGFVKPVITVTNVSLDELSDKSLEALISRNQLRPSLFIRSGALVRVLTDEDGRPSVSPVDEDVMRLKLCRSAEYVKVTQKGIVKTDPPRNVIRNVNAYGSWPGIPPLKGVLQTPIVHPDGYINLNPGYDAKTGYYYHPVDGFDVPKIPDNPTPEDVQKAALLMVEPFKEFPYVDTASFAAVISALLSVMARNLITSPVPLLLINKPAMGTGASKLCEVVAAIATGQNMNTLPQPGSEAEWRKAILPKLEQAPALVCLDNYEGKIDSPYFAALLTLNEWTDRILGKSAMATYTHRCVWIANGNNLKIGTDLPRRSYWCRLDAEVARPWEREGIFTHPDIIAYTMSNRPALVSAVLTIIRSWILSGKKSWEKPDAVKILGGFESWCNTIGGILQHADIAGFLVNQESMYEEVDQDTPVWDAFFSKWYELFGNTLVTTADISDMLRRDNDNYSDNNSLLSVLPETLADNQFKSQQFKVKLGRELARNEGRVFPSNLRLQRAGEKKRAVQWQVEKHSPADKRLTLNDFFSNPSILNNNSESLKEGSKCTYNTGESNESGESVSSGLCKNKPSGLYNTGGDEMNSPNSPDSPNDVSDINYQKLKELYNLPKVVDISTYEKVSLSHGLKCSVKGCTKPAVWRSTQRVYPLPLCHTHHDHLRSLYDVEKEQEGKQ